jgi:membrane protease YdiL (CAAX protease family)
MLLILVTLIASWLILWWDNRNSLTALGFMPTSQRLRQFAFGFAASSLVITIGFFGVALVSGAALSVNAAFTVSDFFSSTYWMLKSVITEELMFRGALLYVAIRRLGILKGCILSSIAFGIYHWFSYDLFGDPGQMIYIFILTGIGGAMFAFAFAVTKSLYLPFGLHFGWNLVSVIIFSQGPLGNQLLVATGGSPLGAWSILFFIYQVVPLPLITYYYLRRGRYHKAGVVA